MAQPRAGASATSVSSMGAPIVSAWICSQSGELEAPPASTMRFGVKASPKLSVMRRVPRQMPSMMARKTWAGVCFSVSPVMAPRDSASV